MPSLRASPGYWIVTALALATLCGPLAVGLAALSGNGHRWVDFLAQLVAPALVATAILFVVLLVMRVWPAALAAGLVMALLFAAAQPQWNPPHAKARAGAPSVTLYSANTHRYNTDAGAIAASIRAARADIVILVEVSPEVARQFSALLPEYPYVVGARTQRQRQMQTVIASRWPLGRMHYIRYVAAGGVVADTPLGKINLVAVHLTRPWPSEFQWGQISQVMAVSDYVAIQSHLPTLIAGDFNSVSSGRIGRQVQSQMGVIPAPGWPGTWPGGLPTGLGLTIDQVYRTPDLALIERRIGVHNGSDHWPVVTRLTLADPGADQRTDLGADPG
ncbi:hypothetical protein BH10PSE2_BH10PSE2_27490 [soil metagenome]